MLNLQEDILIRVNQGDMKSFEHLYHTFYVYLCAVATKYIYMTRKLLKKLSMMSF